MNKPLKLFTVLLFSLFLLSALSCSEFTVHFFRHVADINGKSLKDWKYTKNIAGYVTGGALLEI